MLVLEALCATQNGLEGDVMEVCNSLTFGRLYGGTAPQTVRCSIFGIDNADSPFFAEKRQFLPIFYNIIRKYRKSGIFICTGC
jgi:hypothetical protein